MGNKYKPTDGVPLAVVVAKETVRQNEGIQQTARALALQSPSAPVFRWNYVYLPPLLVGTYLSLVWIALRGSQNKNNFFFESLTEKMAGMLEIISPFLYVGGAAYIIYYFIWGGRARWAKVDAEYEAAQRDHCAHLQVYSRLRYVEQDHTVFDPESGRWVPADTNEVQALIADLARLDASLAEG